MPAEPRSAPLKSRLPNDRQIAQRGAIALEGRPRYPKSSTGVCVANEP